MTKQRNNKPFNALHAKGSALKIFIVAILILIFTQSAPLSVFGEEAYDPPTDYEQPQEPQPPQEQQAPQEHQPPQPTINQPHPQSGQAEAQNGRNIINVTPISEIEQAFESQGDFSSGDYQQPVDLDLEWFFSMLGINMNEEPEPDQDIVRDMTGTNGQLILAPLTPAGGGEVLDRISVGDLEFMTITSQAGNTFFLIIDRTREEDNVYFLTPVTEHYLISLATQAGEGAGISDGGLPGIVQPNLMGQPQGQALQQVEASTGDGGINPIIIFTLALVVGGALIVALKLHFSKKKRERNQDYEVMDVEYYPSEDDEFAQVEHHEAPEAHLTPKLHPVGDSEVEDGDITLEKADGAFDDDSEVVADGRSKE